MAQAQTQLYGFRDKKDVLDASIEYWNPDKTKFWINDGVDLVMGYREGYVFEDIDGHKAIDMHLNGGTFNLGHRNPEVIAVLEEALKTMDVGNHHFPAPGRAALAKRLIELSPGEMSKVVFGSCGGEAVDIAIKSARYATGRRKIVSIIKAYHGHTGLSINTGDERFMKMFHCEESDEYIHVPFNDIDAMESALQGDDVAAVIMETIPATYGFPMPEPGYLHAVKQLCEQHGALYIADEVQTGLGRTRDLWCIQHHGVEPDILVTSKGLSGGIYPISAAVLNDKAAGWLSEDGFAHMGTFGGAEPGCAVALKVLEITMRPETRRHERELESFFAERFAQIQQKYPRTLVEVRHDGLIAGLVYAGKDTAVEVSRMLYERGVWAIFSTLDKSVLQFKAGLLLPMDMAEKVMDAIEEVTGIIDARFSDESADDELDAMPCGSGVAAMV